MYSSNSEKACTRKPHLYVSVLVFVLNVIFKKIQPDVQGRHFSWGRKNILTHFSNEKFQS
jgi:hypothetical protein